jgi:hypothetical protein
MLAVTSRFDGWSRTPLTGLHRIIALRAVAPAERGETDGVSHSI